MSSNPYGQFTGVPMSSDDIESLLVSEGYGILSLAQGDEPYSIPVSFGYDGESIYLGLLELGPEPTKMEFIADGGTARLLITDINHRFDWRSIAIAGPVRSVDKGTEQWEDLLDTLADNAWFMRAFERSDAVESIHGWVLEIDELTGFEQTEES